MCACICVCMRYMHACVHVCMYACMRAHVFAHTQTCVCMHIYINLRALRANRPRVSKFCKISIANLVDDVVVFLGGRGRQFSQSSHQFSFELLFSEIKFMELDLNFFGCETVRRR